MTIVLLANVGTRDVIAPGLAFPDNCKVKDTLLARPAGVFLLQPEVLRAHLAGMELPMIEKALRYIGARPTREPWQHGISPADLELVLFATDQPETVEPRYRNGDTANFAQLIRELVVERYGLVKKKVFVRTTARNPADYDQMHDFYEQELPKIAERVKPDDQVYLLVVGGTQQMNTMLLFLGSAQFGAQAYPLYVAQERDRPMRLDIGRQIARQTVQRNLGVLLEAYAYPTARALVERESVALGEQAVLLALLTYAEQRRNLDLEAATATLDAPIQRTRALRERIAQLQTEIDPLSETIKLRETIFLAQIAAQTGGWADFLARLYRFSEGLMQLIAESPAIGVRWGDARKRSSFQEQWWEEQRAMLAGLGLASPEAGAADNREVDRDTMRLIIDHLASERGHTHYKQALGLLALVDKPIPLRNNIVHRFTPLSETEICQKAGASAADILAAMRAAYQVAFGVAVPVEHPYAEINRLCLQLIEGVQ